MMLSRSLTTYKKYEVDRCDLMRNCLYVLQLPRDITCRKTNHHGTLLTGTIVVTRLPSYILVWSVSDFGWQTNQLWSPASSDWFDIQVFVLPTICLISPSWRRKDMVIEWTCPPPHSPLHTNLDASHPCISICLLFVSKYPNLTKRTLP